MLVFNTLSFEKETNNFVFDLSEWPKEQTAESPE